MSIPPPESSAVCPYCGSDHVVLLAVSPGTPSGERRQEEQSLAPSQSLSTGHDPPGHSDPSNGAGSAPSQAPASHDHHSWSLSPRESQRTEAGGVGGGVLGWPGRADGPPLTPQPLSAAASAPWTTDSGSSWTSRCSQMPRRSSGAASRSVPARPCPVSPSLFPAQQTGQSFWSHQARLPV